MIAAVFKFAYDKRRILPHNPLPAGFRGAFEHEIREVLEPEDFLKIAQLDDQSLSIAQLRTKYCFILQGLTGIDYCDLKTLSREHLKFNKGVMIKKNRQKTGEPFRVPLSSSAKFALDKLREISRGEGNLLVALPTIECTIRHYKKLARLGGVKINLATKIMRHSFAVDCMDNDSRLEDLQAMLGHKKIETTQIYAKVTDNRLREKMSRLQKTAKSIVLNPI